DGLPEPRQIRAVPDVGEIRVDLDDALGRPARGLHVGQERAERLLRLRLEVAGMEHAARLVVGDLAGQEQNRLGACDLDGLTVRRRIVDRLRAELLDLHEGCLLWRRGLRPPLDSPADLRPRYRPALSG